MASDSQKSLQMFRYQPDYGSYDSEVLMKWSNSFLTWNIMPLPLD